VVEGSPPQLAGPPELVGKAPVPASHTANAPARSHFPLWRLGSCRIFREAGSPLSRAFAFRSPRTNSPNGSKPWGRGVRVDVLRRRQFLFVPGSLSTVGTTAASPRRDRSSIRSAIVSDGEVRRTGLGSYKVCGHVLRYAALLARWHGSFGPGRPTPARHHRRPARNRGAGRSLARCDPMRMGSLTADDNS